MNTWPPLLSFLIAALLSVPAITLAKPEAESDWVTIDSIAAVVFGPKGAQVITQFDVERPSLGGQFRKLADVIFERMLFIDAQKHMNALDDEEVVNRSLAVIQRENDLTVDGLKQLFLGAGYSYDEGRDQLKIMQVGGQMLHHRVYANALTPRKAIEQYYHDHPIVEEAVYTVRRALVPFDENKKHSLQKRSLSQKLLHDAESLEWSSPFTILANELAESKRFICDLPVKEFSEPLETPQGFEIFQVLTKQEERIQTLEERKQKIIEILRTQKLAELTDAYKKTLFTEISVVYPQNSQNS